MAVKTVTFGVGAIVFRLSLTNLVFLIYFLLFTFVFLLISHFQFPWKSDSKKV